MTIREALTNLLILLSGLCLLSKALSDKGIGYYPKWFWIVEIVLGCLFSLYGFIVWFIH